jgi:hypothetical protein
MINSMVMPTTTQNAFFSQCPYVRGDRISVCPSGLLSVYWRLSVRPSFGILTSVCPAYYRYTDVCLSVLLSAYDCLSVRTCIRISPSVCLCIRVWSSIRLCIRMIPSVCPCIRMWSSVSPSLYPHKIICLYVLVSAYYHAFALVFAYDRRSVLLSACYQAEFDISEPKEERNLGALPTHGPQLTMQLEHLPNIRVFDIKSVT